MLVYVTNYLEKKEGITLFFSRESKERQMADVPSKEDLPWFDRIDRS